MFGSHALKRWRHAHVLYRWLIELGGGLLIFAVALGVLWYRTTPHTAPAVTIITAPLDIDERYPLPNTTASHALPAGPPPDIDERYPLPNFVNPRLMN